ncbi:MAG: superoxide dismutase [Bacteriovoracaceae bacterium]|nr:superoxide dismutase [Bacteriovoracaceae bacterium]
MKNTFASIIFGLTLIGLSACSMKGHHEANKSIVKLASKSGSNVKGTLYLEDHHGGVMITGKVSGLTPGKHGIHIHETGKCAGRDASSAGAHFHQDAQVHGDKGAKGSHAGDLGNIEADKDGKADINVYAKGLSLGKGANSIADRSIVIHADVDDLKTQPAGNSGKRIACGVITVTACACDSCDKGKCKDKKDCKQCSKGKKDVKDTPKAK